MIIKCPNCNNKFHLRDDTFKLNSVKVRCSKCKEVFTVAVDLNPDEPEPYESPLDEPIDDVAPHSESLHYQTADDQESGDQDMIGQPTDVEIEEISLEDIPDTHDIDEGAIDLEGIFKPGIDMDSELEKTQLFVETEKSPKEEPFRPQKRVDDFDLHKYFDLDHSTPGGYVREGSESVSDGEVIPPSSEGDDLSIQEPLEPVEAKAPEASAPKSQSYKAQSSATHHHPPALYPSEKSGNKLLTIILPALITGVLLIIIVAMLFHFNVFRLGSESDKEQIQPETTSISDLNGYYVVNSKEGEIFVIDGKFTNPGPANRSFTKICGKLYDAEGNLFVAKESYCGNVLTKEKLEKLSKTEIDLKLNNQYGDNSTNVNLPPGAVIPFQLAFFKLTQPMAEFIVECLPEE